MVRRPEVPIIAGMSMKRRHFLTLAAGGGSAVVLPGLARDSDDLIESIEKETLWRNRAGGGVTWFHPRACLVPVKEGKPFVLMTMQEISGSDYFGPVHWTRSDDRGRTWSDPAPIDALGRRPMPGHEGLQKGVCDVVPQHHPATDTVLAMGHAVFYRGNRFSKKDQLPRYPIYSVRRSDGTWSEQKKLEWDDPRGGFIYSNGCGQRVVLPDGDVILAFTFSADGKNREVAGVRCAFDGETLSVKEVGRPLSLAVGRGLMEPSVAEFGGRFYLTIRAEDGHGYAAVSDDGVQYGEKKAWAFDDGGAIEMSTTQQHWMTHSDGLYLVYNRRDESNEKVIRWRSPLWTARVDLEKMCLIRETERLVLPLVGDGVGAPDEVALMGNFHVNAVSPEESWVTVGEWMPKRQARGDVLIGRVRWARPNASVGS